MRDAGREREREKDHRSLVKWMWQLREMDISRSRGGWIEREWQIVQSTTGPHREGTEPNRLGRHVWKTRRADKAPLQGEVGRCSSDCSVPPGCV